MKRCPEGAVLGVAHDRQIGGGAQVQAGLARGRFIGQGARPDVFRQPLERRLIDLEGEGVGGIKKVFRKGITELR